jgi:hypothetical protein
MTAISAWLKLALDIAWAWIALSVLRNILNPPGQYWAEINRVMQVRWSFVDASRRAERSCIT